MSGANHCVHWQPHPSHHNLTMSASLAPECNEVKEYVTHVSEIPNCKQNADFRPDDMTLVSSNGTVKVSPRIPPCLLETRG